MTTAELEEILGSFPDCSGWEASPPLVARTVYLVGVSSGKDSTALWAWALNESGYPPEDVLGTFCDTENEYPEVYKQVADLSAYGELRGAPPIRTLHSEGFLALAVRKRRFPSAKARFCTQVLKMFPTKQFVEELQLQGFTVISHSGVRAAESTERSTMSPEDFDGFLQVTVRRPLLKWTLADVWAAHKRYGLPVNPLYLSGRRRVGCRLCCMSNKQDVRLTAVQRPEVIDLYREWEKIVGGHNGGYQSFFPAKTIPKYLHSLGGFTKKRDSSTGKKGDAYSICTIDEVVKWSTRIRGKQLALDFWWEMEDEPMFEEDDSHHPCASGYCE